MNLYDRRVGLNVDGIDNDRSLACVGGWLPLSPQKESMYYIVLPKRRGAVIFNGRTSGQRDVVQSRCAFIQRDGCVVARSSRQPIYCKK